VISELQKFAISH